MNLKCEVNYNYRRKKGRKITQKREKNLRNENRVSTELRKTARKNHSR